jgi:DNA primase
MPTGAVMYNGTLRNISADTLKIWSAFTWDDGDKFTGRVIFPIRDITGKTVGLIGRLLRDDPTRPKYHIYPPGLKLPLCPAKPKMIQNRVILVEGIFDALNLWDKGLKNAVCCFGTQSVDWVKLSILKMQGATGMDIMFDGDEAGQMAATKVESICDQLGLGHQTIKLKQGNDPGNFTKEGVARLKRRLYG